MSSSPKNPPSYVETTAQLPPADKLSGAPSLVPGHTGYEHEHLGSLQSDPIQLENAPFSWKQYWPLPLYALGCIVHRRYRVWRPRRFLPYFTSLKLPEVYGTLAFGHFASIEADRIAANYENDFIRSIIPLYASVLRVMYKTSREEAHESNDPGGLPLSGRFDLSLMPSMESLTLKSLLMRHIRTAFSDHNSRSYVSHMLISSFLKHPVTPNDADVLVTYLAEKIDMDPETLLSFNGLDADHMFTPTEAVLLTGFTLCGMYSRFVAPLRFSTLCINNMQRLLLYFLAYRTLGARYRHEASLSTFEDPMNIESVIFEALINTGKLELIVGDDGSEGADGHGGSEPEDAGESGESRKSEGSDKLQPEEGSGNGRYPQQLVE